MRCVVFAYSDVGYRCLETLLRSEDEVVAVYSYRDDPNEKIWFPSVVELAQEHGIEVHFEPDAASLREQQPDALFSFYYRDLLPAEWLTIPRIGAFNMHGSLLPMYRGRAPMNWAILEGATETGVTLHEMIERADAGDIVAQRRLKIRDEDDASSLAPKLAHAAARLLEKTLPSIREGRYPRRKQQLHEGCYRGRRRPDDGRLDWRRPAHELRNLVRAVTSPWPGAFCETAAGRLTIWRAAVVADKGRRSPGERLPGDRLRIQTGQGVLEALDWRWESDENVGISTIQSFLTPS